MISKTDSRKIDALDQWCLRMLLDIKWYQFVRNDDVRRLTKQPKLTAYYAHEGRCQEDHVSLPSGRLEKTTKSSLHHVAQHRPTGSETTPCTLRSQKQQIWLRTALCGGWCRRMALRNPELDARNDERRVMKIIRSAIYALAELLVSRIPLF